MALVEQRTHPQWEEQHEGSSSSHWAFHHHLHNLRYWSWLLLKRRELFSKVAFDLGQ